MIKKCIDCYYYWTMNEENKDFMTLVCSKPHLLVYVHKNRDYGSRLWPAKLISVTDDGRAIVEYFGFHAHGNCDLYPCTLYSDSDDDLRKKIQDAIDSKKKIKKEEFVLALKVKNRRFVMNICRSF